MLVTQNYFNRIPKALTEPPESEKALAINPNPDGLIANMTSKTQHYCNVISLLFILKNSKNL
jgi:hypothetical protein